MTRHSSSSGAITNTYRGIHFIVSMIVKYLAIVDAFVLHSKISRTGTIASGSPQTVLLNANSFVPEVAAHMNLVRMGIST